jgi:hypothetical protein
MTDRGAWTLSPSVQRMLMQRPQAMFRKSISLGAFACLQSNVTSLFACRHFAPETLAEDGLLLDWSRVISSIDLNDVLEALLEFDHTEKEKSMETNDE